MITKANVISLKQITNLGWDLMTEGKFDDGIRSAFIIGSATYADIRFDKSVFQYPYVFNLFTAVSSRGKYTNVILTDSSQDWIIHVDL